MKHGFQKLNVSNLVLVIPTSCAPGFRIDFISLDMPTSKSKLLTFFPYLEPFKVTATLLKLKHDEQLLLPKHI